MANNTIHGSEFDLSRFDAAEVHPCIEDADGYVQTCDDSEAQFWSVYLHFNPECDLNEGFGGLDCIADFNSRELAELYAAAMTEILTRINKTKV